MPSCNTYHLTWVSLTLDVGYLLTAAPENKVKDGVDGVVLSHFSRVRLFATL